MGSHVDPRREARLFMLCAERMLRHMWSKSHKALMGAVPQLSSKGLKGVEQKLLTFLEVMTLEMEEELVLEELC